MEQQLVNRILDEISLKTEFQITHKGTRSLSGGCINDGYEFMTSTGSFFVKTNSASKYPGMFNAEARGLAVLTATKSLNIPEKIANGEFENTSYLVIEFIYSAPKKGNYWKDFAVKLASLHQHTDDKFGLDHNNYIGSLPQLNKKCADFPEFFISRRLEPLVAKAVDTGYFDSLTAKKFDSLYGKLAQLIPEEKPALLHGDLWSGNVITDELGNVCLVDPAVYFGHREAELAFSTLFGAFPVEFYDVYNESFPLEKGWKQRIDLFNLYPLLVHMLLFGRTYYSPVKSILKDFL